MQLVRVRIRGFGQTRSEKFPHPDTEIFFAENFLALQWRNTELHADRFKRPMGVRSHVS